MATEVIFMGISWAKHRFRGKICGHWERHWQILVEIYPSHWHQRCMFSHLPDAWDFFVMQTSEDSTNEIPISHRFPGFCWLWDILLYNSLYIYMYNYRDSLWVAVRSWNHALHLDKLGYINSDFLYISNWDTPMFLSSLVDPFPLILPLRNHDLMEKKHKITHIFGTSLQP